MPNAEVIVEKSHKSRALAEAAAAADREFNLLHGRWMASVIKAAEQVRKRPEAVARPSTTKGSLKKSKRPKAYDKKLNTRLGRARLFK